MFSNILLRKFRKPKYKRGVTVITATGDRQIAFELCELWMSRQTYKKPLQWVVVDDGQEYPTKCTMNQEYHRRPPQPGVNTILQNFKELLKYAQYDKILVVDDDDWYHPLYIETMEKLLNNADLVGQNNFMYYNVQHNVYYEYQNIIHSSLCYTAFKSGLIPKIESILLKRSKEPDYWIDHKIWKYLHCKKFKRTGQNLCVGIKGLPGRPGLPYGRSESDLRNYTDDKKLIKLKELIGGDVQFYRKFFITDNSGL